MRLTPRAVKIGLRENTLRLLRSPFPDPPEERSPFQQRRIRQALEAVDLYLRKGRKISEIAAAMHKSHQRVTQVLQLGIDFLCDRRYIRPVTPGHSLKSRTVPQSPEPSPAAPPPA